MLAPILVNVPAWPEILSNGRTILALDRLVSIVAPLVPSCTAICKIPLLAVLLAKRSVVPAAARTVPPFMLNVKRSLLLFVTDAAAIYRIDLAVSMPPVIV